MNPTSTDAMKASLSEAGGHLKQAASHAGEAIKGAAAEEVEVMGGVTHFINSTYADHIKGLLINLHTK